MEMELPEFVEIIDKDTLKVKTSNWDGTYENTVTRADVEEYWNRDVHNMSSGYRKIGVIGGDWRPIHDLAEILKDIFDELSKEDRNAEEKNAKEQIEKEKKKNKGGK